MCLKHVENGITSKKIKTGNSGGFCFAPSRKKVLLPPPLLLLLPTEGASPRAAVRRRVWTGVVLQKQLGLGDVDAAEFFFD